MPPLTGLRTFLRPHAAHHQQARSLIQAFARLMRPIRAGTINIKPAAARVR